MGPPIQGQDDSIGVKLHNFTICNLFIQIHFVSLYHAPARFFTTFCDISMTALLQEQRCGTVPRPALGAQDYGQGAGAHAAGVILSMTTAAQSAPSVLASRSLPAQ